MTHEEIEELVPLLALDALSPPEELQVRTHVETCESCSRLLREHLDTAGDLALLAGPAAPPAGLKTRIMDEVSKEGVSAPPGAAPSGEPTSPPWWRRVGVGLAAAAVLLVGVAVFAYYKVVPNAERQDAILELLSGNPAPTMIMSATDSGGGATGRVVEKGGKAAVVLEGLDRNARGVYELWAIRDGKPSPIQPVEERDWLPKPGRAVILLEDGIRGADGLALSLEPSEPSGSGAKPKGPILLSS
jgi:anti-sigma-K factor RskA